MSNSQRIPSERTALPSWLTPFFEDFEREAIRFTPDSEAQQVLVKYLRILSRPLTTPGLRYVVLNHIRELITVALVAADDGAAKANRLGVREATRLEAIKADIFENLSSPELTQTTVALRQRVTSRYIRRLFKEEGITFSKFVLRHRLMQAHRMLSDPLCADMRITDIALAVGFSDLSYFDRTFRQQFHATPSTLRAIRIRSLGASSGMEPNRAAHPQQPEGKAGPDQPC